MKRIIAYTNDWSLAPGDTLEVKVSTYGPARYRADLVRVICGDDEPSRDIYREEEVEAPFAGDYPGRTQIMPAGSHVCVPNGCELQYLESFTVQVWVFPTTPEKGEQGLVSHWDEDAQTGFALIVDGSGAAALRIGAGTGKVTFFETPAGGGVFSVGSIAWGGSLPHDGYENNVARISENVLRRFLDPKPFAMPE